MTPHRKEGRFVPGYSYSPRTQFKKGMRTAPATEFKAGQEAHNRLPLGSVRIRRETHTGLDRAWIKTAEPNVWRKRAVVVWEAAHGPVPRGSVVHHRDRNSLNDSIDNLQGLTRKQHADEHRGELIAGRTTYIRHSAPRHAACGRPQGRPYADDCQFANFTFRRLGHDRA